MASSLRTKLRIAYNVLFAPGFFDAIAGYFVWAPVRDAWRGNASTDTRYKDLSGALHIHTTYSDGAGDVQTVMAAAKQADVDFVLLCDHNTMEPLRDGWQERYAQETPFLMIGTEVTVKDGRFLLALDAPPAYEPNKGVPAQQEINAIRESGAMPLISLPFDMKHPFEEWSVSGYDGLEVLNFSTIARRHINFLSLFWILAVMRLGGMLAAIRAMVSRPDAALARWDSLTVGGERQIVGIGSLDAHAQMKIGRKKYPIPSYTDSFRAAQTHVLLPESELSANGPEARIDLVNKAIREGHCYFSYDCLGDPTNFSFTATNEREHDTRESYQPPKAIMGDRLHCHNETDTVRFTAQVPGEKVLLRLYENGTVLASTTGGTLSVALPAKPGAYRIEAYHYTAQCGPLFIGTRPWLWSNPIYITKNNL